MSLIKQLQNTVNYQIL